jgi:hypothetical protein
MTGFQSKQAAAQAKLTDDDDIQDYKRPWVGLTDEELREFDVDPIEAKLMIAKLKEKNHG